jgi:hypothetical protein
VVAQEIFQLADALDEAQFRIDFIDNGNHDLLYCPLLQPQSTAAGLW